MPDPVANAAAVMQKAEVLLVEALHGQVAVDVLGQVREMPAVRGPRDGDPVGDPIDRARVKAGRATARRASRARHSRRDVHASAAYPAAGSGKSAERKALDRARQRAVGLCLDRPGDPAGILEEFL